MPRTYSLCWGVVRFEGHGSERWTGAARSCASGDLQCVHAAAKPGCVVGSAPCFDLDTDPVPVDAHAALAGRITVPSPGAPPCLEPAQVSCPAGAYRVQTSATDATCRTCTPGFYCPDGGAKARPLRSSLPCELKVVGTATA